MARQPAEAVADLAVASFRERAPRLCILTQYFPPEMGAPQARLSEFADLLAHRGWSVTVLTALPNYPTGRILPGYSRLRSCLQQQSEVLVARVPLVPSRRGMGRRLLTYLSFAASAMVLGSRMCTRPDVLWVESPPLFVGLAAMYLSRHWRCPYVLNVSDLWPQSVVEMGALRRGPAVTALEWLERRIYARSAAVTGQSHEIVAAVQDKAAGKAVHLISNGVRVERFGRDQATEQGRALLGPFAGTTFLYAGLFGHAQGLEQILDVAQVLARADVRFVLVGDGPQREFLQRRATQQGLGSVVILPAQPRDAVPALLACADVALITLLGRLRGAVPSKIYEAMASGLPILLVADGEPAARVRRARCGICVSPGDPLALKDAVLRLADDRPLRRRLGAAGRRVAREQYARESIAGELHEVLQGVCRGAC